MPPSGAHLMGTDQLGRDVLSRVLYGGRYTLLSAAVAVLIAAGAGIPLGLIAGYVRAWPAGADHARDGCDAGLPGPAAGAGDRHHRRPRPHERDGGDRHRLHPHLRASGLRRGALGARRRLRARRPPDRVLAGADRRPPHPAQHFRPDHRGRLQRLRLGDPDRDSPQLPGLRRPAADPGMGRGPRRLQGLAGAGLVGVHVPRRGDRHRDLRCQLLRRRLGRGLWPPLAPPSWCRLSGAGGRARRWSAPPPSPRRPRRPSP